MIGNLKRYFLRRELSELEYRRDRYFAICDALEDRKNETGLKKQVKELFYYRNLQGEYELYNTLISGIEQRIREIQSKLGIDGGN